MIYWGVRIQGQVGRTLSNMKKRKYKRIQSWTVMLGMMVYHHLILRRMMKLQQDTLQSIVK